MMSVNCYAINMLIINNSCKPTALNHPKLYIEKENKLCLTRSGISCSDNLKISTGNNIPEKLKYIQRRIEDTKNNPSKLHAMIINSIARQQWPDILTF